MGQTAGSREVEVRARVGGILLHRNYEEGGRVRQGDLMFEIDPAPYQAALEQAKGALGQAEAKLAQAQRDQVRMFIPLKPWDERKKPGESSFDFVKRVYARGGMQPKSMDLDATAALRVIEQNTAALELNVRVFREVTSDMIREGQSVDRAVQQSFVAHSLKRICDQCANIAESTIFISQGINYKHHCSPAPA